MLYNRKFAMMIVLCVSFLFILPVAGCSKAASTDDHVAFSTTMNFYREEYDPEYRQYDKLIPVDKKTAPEIRIEGIVSSGSILVQVFDPEEQEVQSFTFDKPMKESIPVNEKYGEWKVRISIDEETEGSITISN